MLLACISIIVGLAFSWYQPFRDMVHWRLSILLAMMLGFVFPVLIGYVALALFSGFATATLWSMSYFRTRPN